MATLHLNSSYGLSSTFLPTSHCLNNRIIRTNRSKNLCFMRRANKIRAIGTVPDKDEAITETTTDESQEQDPPSIGFAFVNSVLLPDGTLDMHLREATGGQKLREIMLDNDIELYGPYARPLLNCAGGGTCGTCMVEVVRGKELLNPKTDKEKELLKKKPRNWRLACQTTVGTPESRGMVVIQQLPEWKAHEWNYAMLKQLPTS